MANEIKIMIVYLPSQVPKADIQLMLFTSLFGDAAVIWNGKTRKYEETHKYQREQITKDLLIRVI